MNLLEAEIPIIERLKLRLAAQPDVLVASVATIAGAVDPTTLVPCVYVQPGAAKSPDEKGNGRATLDAQQWTAYVMVKAVPDKRFQEATFQEAGLLLGSVYQALVGWAPAVGFKPFTYGERPLPVIDRGIAVFPITFECVGVLRNDPNA